MAKHFEELRCWQLADALRTEANAISSIREVAQDVKFCNSLRNTSGSVCRNFSEGFTRFSSASIVQFFGYALASLAELQDHLIECRTRKVIDQAKYLRLKDQTEHVKASALNFMGPHVKKSGRPTTAREAQINPTPAHVARST